MKSQHSLLQPFLPIPTTSTTTRGSVASSSSLHHNNSFNDKDLISSSNKTVIVRLLLVFSVAAISLWANYESSKTFQITLVNDAMDSPAGRRFALSYVSNDRATRILLNTSSFIERFLYPDPNQYPKKHIAHVTLRLASRNLSATVIVSAGRKVNDYVIELSPSCLEEANYKEAIMSAVLRAMVRVWIWDGESRAPARLIDGVAEYVADLAGFSPAEVLGAGEWSSECDDGGDGWWWEDKNPRNVARFLHFCEAKKEGFIRRLNQAMRDTWHDRIVDNALGFPARRFCGLYRGSWAAENNTMLVGES